MVFGSYERDDDHPWHRLERGEIPFEQARTEIGVLRPRPGLGEVDPLAVLAELGGASRSPASSWSTSSAHARARGLRTSVVTNNIAEFGNFWRNLLPLDELFDDVVDSSEVKMRKPNPAIFHLACDRLGVEPSRALFVDDHPGNVAGAERAGLSAVCCGFTREEAELAAAEILAAHQVALKHHGLRLRGRRPVLPLPDVGDDAVLPLLRAARSDGLAGW